MSSFAESWGNLVSWCGHFCHQQPERCPGDGRLAGGFCFRCLGIHLAFALGMILFLAMRRRGFLDTRTVAIGLAMVGVAAVEPWLWESTNLTRGVFGLLGGSGLAVLAVPLLAGTLSAEPRIGRGPDPAILVGGGVAGLLLAWVAADPSIVAVLVTSLVATGGLIGLFWVANTLAVARLAGVADRPSRRRWTVSLATVMAAGEILLLSGLTDPGR